ncbi:hypothetical protein BG58_22275 [Caballeronia jiangsuensis]|nr:hypothetical protein BG58_22275 [Caballeronia jiangsuensis]
MELCEQKHDKSYNFLFEGLEFGEQETPWNLNVLLYRGGAGTNIRVGQALIESGALGGPLDDRLPLVQALHQEFSARITSGISKASIAGEIGSVRSMFAFADAENLPMTMATVTASYCHWAAYLVSRTRRRNGAKTKQKTRALSKSSAYSIGSSVGILLNKILERKTPILELTNIESPKRRKRPIGRQAERQNLADTFAFGHLLTDICDALTIKTVKDASLPLTISLRSGLQVALKEPDTWRQMDQTLGLGGRYVLVNCRIQAELCMFIGQTSMNITQAQNLPLRRFFYAGHIDGYQVKDHKNRRHGPVLFEIFKDYKPHFERYLEWRRTIFKDSDLLFPLIHRQGTLPTTEFMPRVLRQLCEQANVAYVVPRQLRGTRVNWLLRRTSDADTTSELVQNTKEVLLNIYHRPSEQRAMGEVIRFWNKVDPSIASTEAVAPGGCDGAKPELNTNTPRGAPAPDCRRPSGCLWCSNHRDIDTLDYVWALVSFKHLKIIELSRGPVPKAGDDAPPAELVVARIDEKLRGLAESNELRRAWVVEAETRIAEGDFHVSFSDEMQELEDSA